MRRESMQTSKQERQETINWKWQSWSSFVQLQLPRHPLSPVLQYSSLPKAEIGDRSLASFFFFFTSPYIYICVCVWVKSLHARVDLTVAQEAMEEYWNGVEKKKNWRAPPLCCRWEYLTEIEYVDALYLSTFFCVWVLLICIRTHQQSKTKEHIQRDLRQLSVWVNLISDTFPSFLDENRHIPV